MRYGRSLAEAVTSGAFDPAGLDGLPGEQASARLMALPGVGRWTAEIYRMFALGDRDVFPVGDLALREGVRMALALADHHIRVKVHNPVRVVITHVLENFKFIVYICV